MAITDDNLDLTTKDLANAFSDPHWGEKFPPILTIDQAAQLLQIPKLTIYDWKSRGLLKGSCRKVGKHLRFFRDRLLLLVFNEGIHNHG